MEHRHASARHGHFDQPVVTAPAIDDGQIGRGAVLARNGGPRPAIFDRNVGRSGRAARGQQQRCECEKWPHAVWSVRQIAA